MLRPAQTASAAETPNTGHAFAVAWGCDSSGCEGATDAEHIARWHGATSLWKTTVTAAAHSHRRTLSLPAARHAIVAAACLGMGFTQLTQSPATTQFAISLGGGALHVGILTALPFALLMMQVVAAAWARSWRRRKYIWVGTSLAQRLVYVPIAAGPWLWPSVPDAVWLWSLVAAAAASQALQHFGTPLWLSWMGDYLPPEGLNAFWGSRHRWTQWTAAITLGAVACFCLSQQAALRQAFSIMLGCAVVLGVAESLLFLWIEEPECTVQQRRTWWAAAAAPFRDRDFRSFIGFSCFWHVATMTGAPFIGMYLLDYVRMDLFHVLLLWMLSWMGGSLCSRTFGRLVDRHGQRPLLNVCTAFKSMLMVALLAVPPEPHTAFWLLLPIFMFDALLNSGIAIANNGFLLLRSPREDRAMFIAAGTAVAGMIGGLTSVISGWLLGQASGWQTVWHGRVLVPYHVAFAISVGLRLMAAWLSLRIEETGADPARELILSLFRPERDEPPAAVPAWEQAAPIRRAA